MKSKTVKANKKNGWWTRIRKNGEKYRVEKYQKENPKSMINTEWGDLKTAIEDFYRLSGAKKKSTKVKK